MSYPPHTPRAAPRFDDRFLAEFTSLYSTALRGQVRQWQQAVEELGAGRYGIGAAASDLRESTERALTLSADLVAVWSRSFFLPDNTEVLARTGRRDHGRRPPPRPVDPEPQSETPPEPAAPPSSSPAANPAPGSAPRPPTRKAGARQKAERFLSETLGTGEKLSRELLGLAKAQGISESTLQRAKRRLGVRSRREGFGRKSRVFWHFPRES